MSASVPVKFLYTQAPITSSTGYVTYDVDFSPIVRSISYSNGRTNFTDSFNPGSAQMVINNDNNEAKRLDIGTGVRIVFSNTLYFDTLVESIDYDDSRGVKLGATATVTLSPGSARLARINAVSKAMTATNAMYNLTKFNSAAAPIPGSGPLPYMLQFNFLGALSGEGITQGAQTYSGTILQYLQDSQQGEACHPWERTDSTYGTTVYCPAFENQYLYMPTVSAGSITFDTAVSNTAIAYEEIHRNYNDSEIANTVTVTPRGLSAQTVTNPESVSSYDARTYSRSSLDYATATSLSTAAWLASVMSDRAIQLFEISFTAEAQNTTALSTFFTRMQDAHIVFRLNYRPAGSNLMQYEYVIVTNFAFTSTPDKTVFTLMLHPLNMYLPARTDYTGTGSQSFNKVGTSRINLLPNPSAETNTNGYGTMSTSLTLSVGRPPFTFIGYGSVKATPTAAGTGHRVTIGDNREPNFNNYCKSSTTYTFSCYILFPATNGGNGSMRINYQGYTYAFFNTNSSSSGNVVCPKGVWTRVSHTFTTNGSTNRFQIYVNSNNSLSLTDVFYVDNCLLEQTGTLDEYFDGSMKPAEWQLAANDSYSVLDSNYFRFGRTTP